VRDGHEPNDAEEQRPCRVPIEPVHVVSPRKDRREEQGYQHSAKASRGFGAFCAAVLSQRPAAALTASVIRSLGVVDAFSRSRASRVPTCRRHQVGRSSISRPFEQAAVVFSPIGASVLVHNVAVRFGAHDGIQSDIAPTPKSAIQRHSKVSAPDLFWRHRTEMAHPREQADRAASARRRSAASFRRTKIASEYPAAINRPNEIMLSTPEILWISAPTA